MDREGGSERMTIAATQLDHYRNEFAALGSQLPGLGLNWIEKTRQGAFERFAQLGFPDPRDENWKYTRVTPIEKRAFRSVPKSCVGLIPEDIEHFFFGTLPCHKLVFVNGQYTPQLSKLGALPGGVSVSSLAKALTDDPTRLEPYLARYADAGAHGFTALNTAFMADGAFLYFPRDTVLEYPVHMLFVATTQDEELFVHPRNLVVAEQGSEATVIESYVSLGGSGYFTNALTEVVVGENASVNHYKLQQEHLSAFHIATLQVQQKRDSRFTSHSTSFGGALVRNDINAVIDAEGAQCALNGLYMAGGRQHVDYHTRIDHTKPFGTSREHYKGILSGRARGVFNGLTHVHPGAQKTDASQSNDNLLLSRDAEVDTKPQLEIYADDVKCSHGATVGQLDEDMIFYLRARGIEAQAARGLLTYGFAQDVVDRMHLAAVRNAVEEVLLGQLPDTNRIRRLVN